MRDSQHPADDAPIAAPVYSEAYHGAPWAAMVLAVPVGRVLDVNQAWLNLFKFESGDIVGKGLLDLPLFRGESTRGKFLQLLDPARAPACVEATLFTHCGQSLSIQLNALALNSGPVPYVVLYYLDVTQRRRAERELRSLSTAVSQSMESVVITDLAGRIEFVNDAFLRNSGYTREELLGHNPRVLQSGRTPSEVYQQMWDVLGRGETWRGEFINRRKNGTYYHEAVVISPIRQFDGVVSHYVAVKEDLTEKKAAAEQIQRLALRDLLTGLSNRAGLLERMDFAIESSRRSGHIGALLRFNLDRFKMLNDAYGISVGDDLLVEIAESVGSLLQEGQTLARLGADDFAFFLPEAGADRQGAARQALHLAEDIHQLLGQGFATDSDLPREQSLVAVTACIGITLAPDNASDTALEVMRRADTALHRAKRLGQAETAFFERDMELAASERYGLECGLRRALVQGELRLFLQSQVEPDGHCSSAECLVRWQHPERGLLPPAAFMDIAEESGLVFELGKWVLKQACAIILRAHAAGRHLRLSVNVSPKQFRNPEFVPWLRELLLTTSTPGDRLVLEVTENLMIHDVDQTIVGMTELIKLGVSFSVDDFGTGYSALAYLRRLPIVELKIDRAFVQGACVNPKDAALVEIMLAAARLLDLRVVAEGVETPEQARFLQDRAQVIHQGYLYGRPVPAEHWLKTWLVDDRSAPPQVDCAIAA